MTITTNQVTAAARTRHKLKSILLLDILECWRVETANWRLTPPTFPNFMQPTSFSQYAEEWRLSVLEISSAAEQFFNDQVPRS